MLFKSAVGVSERKSRLWIFGVRKSKIYYCSIVRKSFFLRIFTFLPMFVCEIIRAQLFELKIQKSLVQKCRFLSREKKHYTSCFEKCIRKVHFFLHYGIFFLFLVTQNSEVIPPKSTLFFKRRRKPNFVIGTLPKADKIRIPREVASSIFYVHHV